MIIHLLANADFTNYQYHEVYIPATVAATLNGVTLPATVNDVTLPIGISTSTNNSGAFYLIGKTKPEFYKDVNGNYPIKG
jgi:hypothetical protein